MILHILNSHFVHYVAHNGKRGAIVTFSHSAVTRAPIQVEIFQSLTITYSFRMRAHRVSGLLALSLLSFVMKISLVFWPDLRAADPSVKYFCSSQYHCAEKQVDTKEFLSWVNINSFSSSWFYDPTEAVRIQREIT